MPEISRDLIRHGRLIDADTGSLLWVGLGRAVEGSGNGQDGLLAAAIVALIDQVVDRVDVHGRQVAQRANLNMVSDQQNGLPIGPYNPGHVTDPRVIRIVLRDEKYERRD